QGALHSDDGLLRIRHVGTLFAQRGAPEGPLHSTLDPTGKKAGGRLHLSPTPEGGSSPLKLRRYISLHRSCLFSSLALCFLAGCPVPRAPNAPPAPPRLRLHEVAQH